MRSCTWCACLRTTVWATPGLIPPAGDLDILDQEMLLLDLVTVQNRLLRIGETCAGPRRGRNSRR